MPTPLAQLRQAERKLSLFIQALPDLNRSLDHQLRTSFPGLPAHSCTNDLYITQSVAPEPGQTSKLVSYSLSNLIEHSYLSGHVPVHTPDATTLYNYAYPPDKQALAPNISIGQIEMFVKNTINNLELCASSALEHFWKTPNPDLENKRPKEWFSSFTRHLITTEATVRLVDKTLSTESHAAIQKVHYLTTAQARIDSGATSLQRTYSVVLKGETPTQDIPLLGLLVIADSSASLAEEVKKPEHHNVVIFMPSSGLEEFDSLYALSQELKARLKDTYQREALLNCALLKDRQSALSLNEIDYREITTDVFDNYVTELINKQSQDMAYTWETVRAQHAQYTPETLSHMLDKALAASLAINPTGILKTRYARLLEIQLPSWLTLASDEHKQQWRQAVENLKHERLLSQTTETTPLLENGQKSTLLNYARARLKQQIRTDHQLDVDPDQIIITTTEALITSPGFYPLSTSGYSAGVSVHRTGPTITYTSTQRSLSELALENIGLLDVSFALTARVLGPDGKNHTTLTTAYLKALVRTLDIGTSYQSLLYKTLIDPDSEQVRWRKERYIAMTTTQLRLDILEAKLAGHLSPEETAYVDTALNHPYGNTRPTINGSPVNVYLVTLRSKTVPGLLVITSGASNLLCYTPNAPDKVWFRRAHSLSSLATALSRRTLHNYVLQRTSHTTQPYIKHSFKRGSSDIDIGLKLISNDFLHASYNEEAAFALRNADEQSTSTFEANVQTAKDVTLAVIDVMSFALPLKVLLPLTLARFIYSVAEGLDALERDEHAEALLHFLNSISHLTDSATDCASSIVFGRAIRQRTKTPRLSINPKAASTQSRAGMTLRDSDVYGSGIYEHTEAGTGRTHYYLQDDQGNLYRSHYDNLNDTWRIVDERQPDAIYSLAVSQLSEGRWGVSSRQADSLSLHELIEKASVTIDLTAHQPDTNGIYKVNNLYYIQQSGVVFEVRQGWWERHLYLNLPGTSHSSQTTYKVRRSAEQGDWEVKRRINNTTKRWDTLSLVSSRRSPAPLDSPIAIYSDYDVATEHVNNLQLMTSDLNVDPDFHNYGYMRNPEWEAARDHISKIQKKMLAHALIFLNTHTPPLRAQLPDLSVHTSQDKIFKTLFEHYPGIVIGETHSDAGGKKIIIENMAYFAKHNVKVLYMEHLQTDLHQTHLDTFFKTAKMPPPLESFLKTQDVGHGVDKHRPYTFTSLIQHAQRHGIRIKAIDCLASYNIKGLSLPQSKSPRHEIFSFGASQIIRKHTAQTGGHKWIALTGNSHANTFKAVPGLAEIEGAVGLRVQDVAPGTGQGIRPDSGYIEHNPLRIYDYAFLKNDLVLDIEVPGTTPAPPPLSNIRLAEKLPEPRMYTFENATSLGPMLIHRSNQGLLIETSFTFESDGRFHINQPEWPSIHQKRYQDLNNMLADLHKLGMRRVQ